MRDCELKSMESKYLLLQKKEISIFPNERLLIKVNGKQIFVITKKEITIFPNERLRIKVNGKQIFVITNKKDNNISK